MSAPPVRELVNVFEMEAEARRKLAPALFEELGSASRAAFDRITFRPRLMRDVTALDLSVELFGEKHFTPLLVGPIAAPERFHPGGAGALREGAAAAQTTLVEGKGGAGWVALEPGDPVPENAKVLVLRPGDMRRTRLPVVVKGVLRAEDAHTAASRGARGIIVSAWGVPEAVSPLDALPSIAEAVGGRLTILADGGFRRGTDIAKALALGAHAVLVARPAIWGLAAYGAEGVQVALELLQAELARAVAMLGCVNVKQLDRAALRLHRW